jgi:hypothetical protein
VSGGRTRPASTRLCSRIIVWSNSCRACPWWRCTLFLRFYTSSRTT